MKVSNILGRRDCALNQEQITPSIKLHFLTVVLLQSLAFHLLLFMQCLAPEDILLIGSSLQQLNT